MQLHKLKTKIVGEPSRLPAPNYKKIKKDREGQKKKLRLPRQSGAQHPSN
jgi:hypothetical protein